MTGRLRTTAPIALLCLVGLTAAGCGDSNSSLSYSELVSKANAICTDVNAQTKAAQASKDYDKLLTDGTAALAKLKALKPPDELKDTYNAYLDAQTGQVKVAKPIIAALKAGDTAQAQQLAQAAQPQTKATNDAASAAGLAACANDS